jgi:hypothetical protein
MKLCIMFFPLLFYLINLICLSISIIVCLNKKIILINKFSKHNKVNISFSRLNILIYTCLLNFQILFLVIINDFLFIYLFTHITINLFNYINKIFYLNLIFLNYRNVLKKYVLNYKNILKKLVYVNCF